MENNNILFEKQNFKLIKKNKNNYFFSFSIENNTIDISKLIDFSFIKLIYQLNDDIYETITFTNIDENTIIATVVMKHFFQDLGISQKYLHIAINKQIKSNNNIEFNSISIVNDHDNKPINIPFKSESICIKNLIINCNCITPNNIYFEINIVLDDIVNMPSYVENFIGPIVFKIFNRVKQFINNIKL
jgi:hypothetical protein